MKKLAFSLICANAFASNFVGLGFYGSNADTKNAEGLDIEDKRIYHYEIFANKFYSEGENNFVYDAKLGYSHYKSNIKAIEENVEVKASVKVKAFSLQALAGYGILVGNDVSLSFLGGIGYENAKYTASNFSATLGNVTKIVDLSSSEKDNSMFLKAGVAARKQFENNFTMSGGVYLKYYFDKILEKDLNAEFDISLGYTFSNNIYAGVKFAYVDDISKGGSAGIGLSYKF